MFKKIISLAVSAVFSLQTCGFAQVAQLNLAGYLGQAGSVTSLDRFRPASLRYFSYEPKTDNFQILLDKADEKGLSDIQVKEKADELMKYFRIGLSLPNEKFWVNLRPDAPEQIIDPELEKTDIGRIMLEADLNLKKDTSAWTSPQTKEGREYWDKLYKKAGELFGSENITIPTITRPWIVPGEIIVRESGSGAYIYKAALKVMLEEDYLTSRGGSRTAPTYQQYAFSDPRLKELNQYSTQLIRELIIPKLTKEVNRAKRYAPLRQVFYSLVLSRWFKDKFNQSQSGNELTKLIDSGNLSNLSSQEAWDKTTYFQAYQKSFKEGEYNLSEPIYTPTGQVIRRYMSGGMFTMPTKEQIKNGFDAKAEMTSSAVEAKDKVLLLNGKEVRKAGDIWTEDQANIMVDSLKRSREALNNLIEEMIEVKNSKGNEDQVLTSLLTTLSEQLIRIDKIGVDLQPEAALETIEKTVGDLIKEEPGLTVNLSLRSEILHITIPTLESTIKTLRESQGSGSAIEASRKTESPAIISAVKSLQDKLPDDVNEQVLKFIANVNPNGELEYPIKKDDPVMIGHVRGDRAGYLALGLQTSGFENLLGYIKFNKNFKGASMLSEEAVGKIENTFFERLSKA